MKIQLRNYHCCDADVVEVAEGSIRDDRNCEGRTGIAGVASSGHVPKGFPRNPGELAISPLARAVTRSPRETRGEREGMDEQSFEPTVPMKVGNRRASARSGHGTHWREGGNRCTYLTKGNIADVQNSILCPHKSTDQLT